MTDDKELTKLAWDLVKAMADSVGLPENVEMQENPSGSVTFIHHVHSYSGCGKFYFIPNINFIKSTIKSSDKVLADICEKRPHGNILLHEGRTSFTNAILYGFMKTFHIEIKEAFDNFFRIPTLILSEITNGVLAELEGSKQKKYKIAKKQTYAKLDEHLREQAKRKKERLYKDLIDFNREETPAKHLIDAFYSSYLPDWEKAKEFYKKNKQYKNWQQMASLAFDFFPEDLIERLADADPYRAMPSSIALEHAARSCGFEPDIYSTRNLQNFLKESRQWITENGEKATVEAVEQYVTTAFSSAAQDIRSALLFGIEPNFERMHYICRKHMKLDWEEYKNTQDFQESNEIKSN